MAELTITGQKVEAVEWEENFKGHHPSGFVSLGKSFTDELSFEAEGIGFVIRAHAARKDPAAVHGVINASLFINGEEVERANFPTDPLKSRTELFWRYNLPKGKHLIKIKINDPNPSYEIRTVDCLQYDDKKLVGQR